MSSAPVVDRAESAHSDASTRVSELFEKHGRMVYGICRAMLRDPQDAEDATQQAFLSAYRALLGGAEVRDEGAWLATIARNECRARIGASMRAPLPIADEDLASIPAAADETERRFQAEALQSALAALPERQREAVVLRYLYGLRYSEVATALGLSRPATEALLFRARRALKHRLRPVVATTLAVPVAVQEALAQAIPGFAATGSGAAFAGAAGGGILAKLTAGPVGTKVATAAVAVSTVGTVGGVESERAGRDRAERPAVLAEVSPGSATRDDSSGPGSGRAEDRADGDRDDNSGPGGGGDDDNSGPGSDDDRERDDSREEDGSSSGPGPGVRDSTADDRSGSSSGGGSGSRGSGSSGSGSSGPGSSGSGDDD